MIDSTGTIASGVLFNTYEIRLMTLGISTNVYVISSELIALGQIL